MPRPPVRSAPAPTRCGAPDAGDGDGEERAIAVDPGVWLWHVTYERTRARPLRDALIEDYTPYSHSLARRAFHHGEPLDDLRQVALVALIGALERFECERSIPFVGFATPTIIGALKRHHRDNDWALRVPRRAHAVATSLARAEARLDARIAGRTATQAELAAELGLAPSDLADAQAALRGRITQSLDAPAARGPDLPIDLAVADEGFHQAETRVDLPDALDALTPDDRRVLLQYYFEGRSQREVGEALHMSQMHVSRLLSSAIRRLRSRMDVVDGPVPGRPAGRARRAGDG
ncbi:sigma-70 family RNA polymerase sigma factor [Iamia sp. SCSIO 61187]|uniref:sigma-70 family RNA polymerase sigma factor n=1 Tax=Iamia sp. SCSIO 61187 TaxID=2722752 RepID=UPI001C6368C6|nr:sigma-70 family RNA polymerase sigma factor [Iamia sp. SCSIO 61187]QYG92480.1 sigma-70 family RNA polymerase sigma factor [Iamia sp. SCSIO 61187]